jgi:dihydropteroate synthase
MLPLASSAPPALARRALDCRGRPLPLGRPHVMGVLNVTPDSFSDGGRYAGVRAAVERAREMAEAGAAIVDVGGESTRPGARPVGLDEELDRVVPVVEAIAREVPHVLISVDTVKGAVAREALRAGAHVVNDVTGLREGVGTAAAAAEYGAPLVVMHSLAKTGGTAPADAYGDVVGDVTASLRRAVARAEGAGVRDVIVDPGFGFGKSTTQNLRLIAEVDRLVAEGWPVLVGVSRKSTVGALLGTPERPAPVTERLYGSLGLAALAVVRGAHIVRAHDVRETAEVVHAIGAALTASTSWSAAKGAASVAERGKP